MSRDIVKSNFFDNFPKIDHGFIARSENDEDYFNEIEKNIGYKIIYQKQNHSDGISFLEYENNDLSNIESDAIITKEKNIAIGIKSADCLPILIYAKNIDIIACIHAGWNGIFKDIIQKTLEKLKFLEAKNDEIYLLIGPAISWESYEVSEDFRENFQKKDEKFDQCFSLIHEKWHFDLKKAAKLQIGNFSTEIQISDININTFADFRFTSYRRLKYNNSSAKYEQLKNFFSYIVIK